MLGHKALELPVSFPSCTFDVCVDASSHSSIPSFALGSGNSKDGQSPEVAEKGEGDKLSVDIEKHRLARTSPSRPVRGAAHLPGTAEAYSKLWQPTGSLTQEADKTARRIQGAMLGALVADAAATGVTGVFDISLLHRMAKEREQDEKKPCGLEFLHPPRGPLSKYKAGRGTVLGDQARVLLLSLVHEGGFSCQKYAALAYATFAAPEEASVLDTSTQGFLRNYAAGMLPPYSGINDAQASCLTRVIPLVCLLVGDPQLPAAVEQLIRTTQDSDAAVVWGSTAARILEGMLLGRSAVGALRAALAELLTNAPGVEETSSEARLNAEVRRGLGLVLQLCEEGKTSREAMATLGRHSYLPTALLTPIFLLLSLEQKAGSAHNPHNYPKGVRLALLGGGCCASRAMFLGACLGAAGGIGVIPPRWLKRCKRSKEVSQQTQQLCQLRTAHLQDDGGPGPSPLQPSPSRSSPSKATMSSPQSSAISMSRLQSCGRPAATDKDHQGDSSETEEGGGSGGEGKIAGREAQKSIGEVEGGPHSRTDGIESRGSLEENELDRHHPDPR